MIHFNQLKHPANVFLTDLIGPTGVVTPTQQVKLQVIRQNNHVNCPYPSDPTPPHYTPPVAL